MTEIVFENSLSVGEPKVDLYENQSAEQATRQISLNEWLCNSDNRDFVEQARTMSLGVFKARLISELPCITPSGTLTNPLYPIWPPRPAIFSFNSFICIEVVNEGATFGELERLKAGLSARFENLYYAGLSITGNRLVLIFRIFSMGHYGLEYMSICDVLREYLGLRVDVSYLNFRHRLPPLYDPDAYFNPLATDNFHVSFRLGRWSNKGERNYEESKRINHQVAVLVYGIIESKVQMLEDNRIGSQIGCSLVAEFGEYGRCYFNQIASVSNGYTEAKSNALYDSCIKYTNQSVSEGRGYRSSIGTFFHHCKEHGLTIPTFNKL